MVVPVHGNHGEIDFADSFSDERNRIASEANDREKRKQEQEYGFLHTPSDRHEKVSPFVSGKTVVTPKGLPRPDENPFPPRESISSGFGPRAKSPRRLREKPRFRARDLSNRAMLG